MKKGKENDFTNLEKVVEKEGLGGSAEAGRPVGEKRPVRSVREMYPRPFQMSPQLPAC